MEQSILKSVKKTLGVPDDLDSFDEEIALHINAALSTLQQLGVVFLLSPAIIDSEDTNWDDLHEDKEALALIRQYIHLKVKNLFDPPSTSYVLEAGNKVISELEFRINVLLDIDPIIS